MNTDVFRDRPTAMGAKSGTARLVRMSDALRDGDTTIWFTTARDTVLAAARLSP